MEKLSKLRIDKAPDVDGLLPRLMVHVENEMLSSQCLFRMPLDSGNIPADWKRANVSPKYKKVRKVMLLITDQ